jgi:hypothetical protein
MPGFGSFLSTTNGRVCAPSAPVEQSGSCLHLAKGIRHSDASWYPIRIFLGLYLFATISVMQGTAKAGEDDWLIRPPAPQRTKVAPERHGVGASVDNLPVPPAVPMRQSESKDPPAPDILMAKAVWGEESTFETFSEARQPLSDWNLVTADTERFVDEAQALDLTFRWGSVNLANFSFDPAQTPSLLFSGVRTLRIDKTLVQRLREYVVRGGMIICDSVYGAPYFYDSVKAVFEPAFGSEPFRVLPLDHPIYHVFHDIGTVGYPSAPERKEPFLEGIYVGSRVGVLLSKYGLGTGWEGDQAIMASLVERSLQPQYYDPPSARRLAANLAAYIVGYADAGAAEGRPELFESTDRTAPTDEFVFAQLRHEGAWNVHPGAASRLLYRLRQHTAIRVNMKRVVVDPGRDNLSVYPFLYLTGLDNFIWRDNELRALQSFMADGGRLLVNNGLGLATFDQAVRRELARLLPGVPLQPIPAEHNLLRTLGDTETVTYAPGARIAEPDLGRQPVLLGMWVEQDLRVVYSPYDLEAGWMDAYYPILRGYENESAQRLGMSILAYLMTQ